jgi:hypothetical protein
LSFQHIDKRTKTEDTFSNFNNNLYLQNKDKENNQNNLNSPYLSSFYYSNFNFLDNKSIIQAKLKVSQPGDEHEREADRVAEQVMRMSLGLSIISSTTTPTNYEEGIDHKCATCEMKEENEEKDEHLNISRKLSTTSNLETSNEIINLNTSGGSLLDGDTREFMESRFGYDFSQVRVHTDKQAAESAEAVNALAYTVRNDIIFGQGQYSPHTKTGQRLIAHELSHTIQQGRIQSKYPLIHPNLKSAIEQPLATKIPLRISNFTIPMIARQPRTMGGKVLVDNNVLVQLYETGGTRAQEIGVTGRVYTIESIAKEFRDGHGQNAWKEIKEKFNIELLPDPKKSDGQYLKAKQLIGEGNDARLAAASVKHRIPIATQDRRLANAARRLGAIVRRSRSTQPQLESNPPNPRPNPPPTPLRIPPEPTTTPTRPPPTTPQVQTPPTTKPTRPPPTTPQVQTPPTTKPTGPPPTTPQVQTPPTTKPTGPPPTTPQVQTPPTTKPTGPPPTTPQVQTPPTTIQIRPPSVKGAIKTYGKSVAGGLAGVALGLIFSHFTNKFHSSIIENQLQDHVDRIFREELPFYQKGIEGLQFTFPNNPVYVNMNFTLRSSQIIEPETHMRIPTIPVVIYDGTSIGLSISSQSGESTEYFIDEVITYTKFTISHPIDPPKTQPEYIYSLEE